jgi:hypothetical protein
LDQVPAKDEYLRVGGPKLMDGPSRVIAMF